MVATRGMIAYSYKQQIPPLRCASVGMTPLYESSFYFRAYVSISLVREREDAGEGDANPHGTVVEFVEEFVERFLQQMGDEAELSLLRLRDQGWICRVDYELVGAEELSRDGVLPEGNP